MHHSYKSQSWFIKWLILLCGGICRGVIIFERISGIPSRPGLCEPDAVYRTVTKILILSRVKTHFFHISVTRPGDVSCVKIPRLLPVQF